MVNDVFRFYQGFVTAAFWALVPICVLTILQTISFRLQILCQIMRVLVLICVLLGGSGRHRSKRNSCPKLLPFPWPCQSPSSHLPSLHLEALLVYSGNLRTETLSSSIIEGVVHSRPARNILLPLKANFERGEISSDGSAAGKFIQLFYQVAGIIRSRAPVRLLKSYKAQWNINWMACRFRWHQRTMSQHSTKMCNFSSYQHYEIA